MAKESTGSVAIRGGKLFARVTWTDNNGRRREATRRASSLGEARKLISELLKGVNQSKATFTNVFDNNKRTFDDLAIHYEQLYAIAPTYINNQKISGLRAYRDVLHHIRILRKHFFKVKLSNLDYSSIEQFKLERLKVPLKRSGGQRSLSNVHRALSILRTMLTIAERMRWIDKNPFSNGKSLINMSLENSRERILSRDEEELLLAELEKRNDYFKSLFILAIDQE